MDLKTPSSQATGLDVELQNAASACALAEVWFGGRQDLGDLVVVTVSEGIGTAIFANGQLLRGRNRTWPASSATSRSRSRGGPPCRCGNRGCWEVFASNTAALRYYAEEGSNGDPLGFVELLARAERRTSRGPAAALERMARKPRPRRRAAVCRPGARIAHFFVGEVTRAWSKIRPRRF